MGGAEGTRGLRLGGEQPGAGIGRAAGRRSPGAARPRVSADACATGDCDAAIHDRALLDPLFAKMSWQKFSATLPAVEPTTLVVAVAPGEKGLATAVRGALVPLDTSERWQQRREKWAATVSFEVYRDQVAADCH